MSEEGELLKLLGSDAYALIVLRGIPILRRTLITTKGNGTVVNAEESAIAKERR